MNEIKPILRPFFYHDGRGPELQKAHYTDCGAHIEAVDYFNPDDKHSPEKLKHLRFNRAQVFMFTPEEVYNGQPSEIDWSEYQNAAIICLGKSEWFRSFDQRHLSKCNHFHIMFYDQYLDIICEKIVAQQGGYKK